MKFSEGLTVVAIIVTIWAVWKTGQGVQTVAGRVRVNKTKKWQGNGVDPFGAGYTVTKQAAGGGL